MQRQVDGSGRGWRWFQILFWGGVVLLPFGMSAWDHWSRPLFRNTYRNFGWRVTPPAVDTQANFAVVDERLNLLLVVRVASGGREESARLWRCVMFESDRARAGFAYPGVRERIEIPRTTDKLFIVCPDGAVRTAPLRPGEAAIIYSELQHGTPGCLLDVIERVAGSSPEVRAAVLEARVGGWEPLPATTR